MKPNVGNLESFIRIFIGIVMLYSALHSYVGDWGYIGIYFIATGMGRFDPFKAVLGLSNFTGDV